MYDHEDISKEISKFKSISGALKDFIMQNNKRNTNQIL